MTTRCPESLQEVRSNQHHKLHFLWNGKSFVSLALSACGFCRMLAFVWAHVILSPKERQSCEVLKELSLLPNESLSLVRRWASPIPFSPYCQLKMLLLSRPSNRERTKAEGGRWHVCTSELCPTVWKTPGLSIPVGWFLLFLRAHLYLSTVFVVKKKTNTMFILLYSIKKWICRHELDYVKLD